MEMYDKSSDKYMDETATNMVELARELWEQGIDDQVGVKWGDDTVIVTAYDTEEDALTKLEMSADQQQADAFSEQQQKDTGL